MNMLLNLRNFLSFWFSKILEKQKKKKTYFFNDCSKGKKFFKGK